MVHSIVFLKGEVLRATLEAVQVEVFLSPILLVRQVRHQVVPILLLEFRVVLSELLVWSRVKKILLPFLPFRSSVSFVGTFKGYSQSFVNGYLRKGFRCRKQRLNAVC